MLEIDLQQGGEGPKSFLESRQRVFWGATVLFIPDLDKCRRAGAMICTLKVPKSIDIEISIAFMRTLEHPGKMHERW